MKKAVDEGATQREKRPRCFEREGTDHHLWRRMGEGQPGKIRAFAFTYNNKKQQYTLLAFGYGHNNIAAGVERGGGKLASTKEK